jgi:hypothetical protein
MPLGPAGEGGIHRRCRENECASERLHMRFWRPKRTTAIHRGHQKFSSSDSTSPDLAAGARFASVKRNGRLAISLASSVASSTRRSNEWTNRCRKIAADAWHINSGSAVIDGEIVVPAANGTTDFSVLQNELKGRSKRSCWWPSVCSI